MTAEPSEKNTTAARGQLRPLYAAGFVTAFSAHSMAASLGAYTNGQHASLLTLGLLLAVYDGAEVVLKPVFDHSPTASDHARYSWLDCSRSPSHRPRSCMSWLTQARRLATRFAWPMVWQRTMARETCPLN